jgi:predicted O-linked N-acetylglucosamine transferase (SPINDLY family)
MALYMQAMVFDMEDKPDMAVTNLSKLLSIAPDNIAGQVMLWRIYTMQKQYQALYESTDEALNSNQNNLNAYRGKCIALRGLRKTEELIALVNESPVRDPGNNFLFRMVADFLFDSNNYEGAYKYYKLAYDIDQNDLWLLERITVIAGLTFDTGKVDCITESMPIIHHFIKLSPDIMPVSQHIQHVALGAMDFELLAKLADKKTLMQYWAHHDANRSFVRQMSRVESMQDRFDLLEAHLAWGTKMEAETNINEIIRPVRSRLNKKIRIGISSGDFRSNHIGCYIWPLIHNIDKNKYEIYCYSQWPGENDPLEMKFEAIADSFKKFPLTMDDKKVAQSIADDGLDVFIEVGAWFLRPKMVAYRVAPLQISWLDYLHSMGMPTAIDYLVLDPYVMPESSQLLIEKPMVLPSTWMVMHPYGFPAIEIDYQIPQDRNGHITFGCMNSSYRFTDEVFKVWAGIMSKVPNSKFIYLHPESALQIVRDNFVKHMEKYGISQDRLSFIAVRKDFFVHFNKIDIALDPFPHMGNTTICYTVWMALPAITLVGPCFFERVSYSVLSNCGLADLCAFSLQEYHQKALMLVADIDRRREIRRTLRDKVKAGPLGQYKAFADDLTNAISDALGVTHK